MSIDLNQALQLRKSVRRYTNKKPDWRVILECIDCARFAPMAGNIFTLKFLIVDDKEKIIKLAQAAQQEFFSQVGYVVVVCSDIKNITNAYGKRAEKYSKQQAGAAIQNFLLKIQEKGLASCWVGHFSEDIVKQILRIPDEIVVEAILPVGFEHPRKSRRTRKLPLENILFFNEYDNSRMKPLKKFH